MKTRYLITLYLALLCNTAFAMTAEEAKTAYQGLKCEITAVNETGDPTCAKCNDLTELIVHYDPAWDAVEPIPVPEPTPAPTPEPNPEPSPIPAPTSPIWEQDASGLLTIPAAGFSKNTGWTETSGTMSTPEGSPEVNLADTSGPALEYRVKFNRAGKHYVWVHGEKPSSSSDSLYYGLAGVKVNSVNFFSKLWYNQAQDFSLITLEVTAGEHVLNIWQREDGSKFSEIRITADASYVPIVP
mgnify:CR=1 FL=1